MTTHTRPLVLAAAVAALLAATGAQAAEQLVLASLGDVQGKVMVNQGKGFVAARPGMEVRAGDRVIALDGAAARIVYNDGCVTNLKERNLLPIEAKGCATQAVNPNAEVVKLAQAIGGTRSDAPAAAPPPPPSAPVVAATPGWVLPAVLLGAALAAGGGGGDSTPISAR